MKKLYLAGPITSLTYEECTAWRDVVSRELTPCGIECYSPLRFKEFLAGKGELLAMGHPTKALSTPRGIMTRDHNDVYTCDAMLVNLLGARIPSIGTIAEVAWSFAYKKPCVVVMEPEGNPHQHVFITEAAGYIVPTLEEAIHIAKSILLPANPDGRH